MDTVTLKDIIIGRDKRPKTVIIESFVEAVFDFLRHEPQGNVFLFNDARKPWDILFYIAVVLFV